MCDFVISAKDMANCRPTLSLLTKLRREMKWPNKDPYRTDNFWNRTN